MSLSRQYASARYLPSATENLLCLRGDKKCTRQRVEGQKFCLRHISVEEDSAFKRCSYISSRTGRRCSNLLFRADSGKEGFCLEHAQLVTQVRRQAAHRNRFRDTAESLSQSVRHYSHFASNQSHLPREELPGPSKGSKAQRPAIDYYSESSDEDEARECLQDGFPLFTDDVEADIDDSDEPLRHAGTYTTEEISVLARDKLVKLQSLYCEYFKILAQKLKYRRAKYRLQSKIESKKYGSGFSSFGSSYKDWKKLEELRALRRYRKHFGVSSILRQQAQDRRRKAAGLTVKEPVVSLCACTETQEKCFRPSLPGARFCSSHIMLDENQQLFLECAKEGCSQPVFPVGPSVSCWIHKPIPVTKLAVSLPEDGDGEMEQDSEKLPLADKEPPELVAQFPASGQEDSGTKDAEHTYIKCD